MRDLLGRLWSDDDGALLSAEWLCLASIGVFGAVVGMTNVRNSLNAEFSSFGQGLHALNQGQQIPGIGGPSGSVGGSTTIDLGSVAPQNATSIKNDQSLYSVGALPSY